MHQLDVQAAIQVDSARYGIEEATVFQCMMVFCLTCAPLVSNVQCLSRRLLGADWNQQQADHVFALFAALYVMKGLRKAKHRRTLKRQAAAHKRQKRRKRRRIDLHMQCHRPHPVDEACIGARGLTSAHAEGVACPSLAGLAVPRISGSLPWGLNLQLQQIGQDPV